MSNEIVNYEELLAGMATKAAEVERPEVTSIGTRAGVLTYGGDAIPGNKLDCIVIASQYANMLYEGKFDPNDIKNPVCYAYSPDGSDMVPHPSSPNPQHDDCASCPHNQWESDPNGGKGKYCKNTRHLALIPADTSAEDVPTAEVAVLRLPVTSGKNWGQYVNKVSTLYQRPPLGVVTQIGTVPDAKSQYKITFDATGNVDNSLLGGLIERSGNVSKELEREYEANAELTEEEKAKKAKGKKY